MSRYQYNRIVITGNGFDLALGLKTKYSDFLLDYFKGNLRKAINTPFRDNNFEMDTSYYPRILGSLEEIKTLDDWTALLANTHGKWKYSYKGMLNDIMGFYGAGNWVDIESLYFDILVSLVDRMKAAKSRAVNYDRVKELNESFQEITDNLDDYINRINEQEINASNYVTFYKFLEVCVDIQRNHETCLNHEYNYMELDKPENVLFLNFNYTNSLQQLMGSSGVNPKYQIINIHGKAGNPTNPIIFGYGDDTHPKYADLEQENSNIPLEFIKSFYYNRTTDYHKMLNFMESSRYEVYIIGHSCGLSDRTLLKSIFEHDNCISIKIFHRGSIDEHIKKNMAISRHFDDKQLLRKRVLPFDEHAVIPQAK